MRITEKQANKKESSDEKRESFQIYFCTFEISTKNLDNFNDSYPMYQSIKKKDLRLFVLNICGIFFFLFVCLNRDLVSFLFINIVFLYFCFCLFFYVFTS